MNIKGISSCLFFVICFSGFIFQLHQVSELYFRYQTTSKTELQVREVEEYQTIMYCPRFVDLLNRTNYQEYGLRATPPTSAKDIEEDLNSLTIKDILKLTPSESEAIHNCYLTKDIRQNTSGIFYLEHEQCYDYFKVIKSINGERVCYSLMPRKRRSYSVGDAASSQTHTNTVYQIVLNPSLSKTILGYFITYLVDPDKEVDPLDSRIYQARVWNTFTLNQSRCAIYGESTDIHRLPPPYDTRCNPGHNREVCYEECLIQNFRTINRIPWSGFHKHKQNIKMLTSSDLRNSTMSSHTAFWFNQCHLKCKLKTECQTEFSRTFVQEYQNRNHLHTSNFAIISMVPIGPHTSLRTVTILTLVEYIIQIGSCIGVWFGLSIISFNPVKWKILQNSNSTSRVNNNRQRKLFFSKIRRQ